MRRPQVDPAFTFALSLILSLLLCYPTFKNMMHGSVDVTEGAIRYLVALAISWCGVHGVATLVAGYSAQPRRPAPRPPGAAQPMRRQADADDNQQADAA
jgi:hypothetical protein